MDAESSANLHEYKKKKKQKPKIKTNTVKSAHQYANDILHLFFSFLIEMIMILEIYRLLLYRPSYPKTIPLASASALGKHFLMYLTMPWAV